LQQLLKGLHRLHVDESGQVTVWFVCGILVLFGFFALVLNTGVWYLDRRVAQNQADAAALAGVQELPSVAANTGAAREAALDWLQKNGAARQSVCVADGDYDHIDQGVAFADRIGSNDGLYDTIRVCVDRNTLIVFNEFFELAGVKVAAVAAAGLQEKPGVFAIFANDECNGLDNLNLSGSGDPDEPLIVTGHLHSNCEIEISGSEYVFDGVVTCVDEMEGAWDEPDIEYLQGEPDCPHSVLPLPIPDPQTWNEVYPYALKSNGGVCDRIWPDKAVFDSASALTNGVHCVENEIDLTSGVNGLTRNVTLISRNGPLKMSANSLTLTPAWTSSQGYSILLFSRSNKDDAITISGQSNTWTGTMYAPLGRVSYSGSDGSGSHSVFHSSIVADRVIMSGSNWVLSGSELDPQLGEIALIE
jgi:Flp pilus assembly protein TadG